MSPGMATCQLSPSPRSGKVSWCPPAPGDRHGPGGCAPLVAADTPNALWAWGGGRRGQRREEGMGCKGCPVSCSSWGTSGAFELSPDASTLSLCLPAHPATARTESSAAPCSRGPPAAGSRGVNLLPALLAGLWQPWHWWLVARGGGCPRVPLGGHPGSMGEMLGGTGQWECCCEAALLFPAIECCPCPPTGSPKAGMGTAKVVLTRDHQCQGCLTRLGSPFWLWG